MSLLSSIAGENVYGKFPAFAHHLIENIFLRKKYVARKMGNLLLNNLETKLMKSSVVSYPYYLVIDPTNICNLKCPLCPTWQDSQARPKGTMSLKTFRHIFDEIGPYVFAVNLCNWGEPFLNPDLSGIIRHARQYNIVIGLSTNLNSLSDETAGEITRSGIDILVISLDGASQETYSRYRRNGDFSRVIENIRKLNAGKIPGRSFPLLVWQFLVNKYNENEIEKARVMAGDLGMIFLPSPMRTSMGKELLMPLYDRVREIEDWLPENPGYNKYSREIQPGTRTRQASCKWLWNSTVINWDGSLSPCCGVFEKSWDFSSCCSDASGEPMTVHKAWNSPRYKLARRLVAAYMKKSDRLSSLMSESEQERLICANCIRYGFLED